MNSSLHALAGAEQRDEVLLTISKTTLLIMAMINIKEGTLVFVPWRIQGIVRNEERQLNYSIHLLEKQNKYLLNCITRDQIMATNKLDRFTDKFSKAPRVSAIMAKVKRGTVPDLRRLATMVPNSKKPAATMSRMFWQPGKRLPAIPGAAQQPAPPLQQQKSQRIGFLPRSPKERKGPSWPLPNAAGNNTKQWPTVSTLKLNPRN